MAHSNIYKNIVKTGSVLFLTLLYLAWPHSCLAQTTVNGTVVDDYGYPVQGAMVHLKGEKIAQITNKDGVFEIVTTPGAVLVFEYPGYNTIEVKAGSRRPLFVRLPVRYLSQTIPPASKTTPAGDTIYIQKKLVPKLHVLYGETNAHSFLGSIATVGANELGATPASSYTYALPGRLAGLNVIQTSGFYTPLTGSLTSRDIFVGNIPNNTSGAGPSDNTEFNIQLRGHNASMGQSPIVVIDGVQREFYSLDPENIASVSVLKDALSTILLGQNSARGALIVTTKQPVSGAPRVAFTAETGVQTPLQLPKPLPAYQYAYLLNEALLNDSKNPAYTAADFAAYRSQTDPIGHPDVNWYNTILRDQASMNRYNLSVTGGGATAQYVVGLNYMNQNGLFVTSDTNSYNTNAQLKRYMINSRIDIDVNKNFNVGLQLFGRLQDGNQPGAGTATILQGLLSTPNNAYPVYNPNGLFGGSANYTQNLLAQTIASGYMADHLRDVMVNLDLGYKLDNWIKGWWAKAKGNVSVQEASNQDRSKQAPVFSQSISTGGDTAYHRYGSTVNQVNNFTNTSWARYRFVQLSTGYNRQFGNHTIDGMLLFDQKNVLLNYDIPSALTNYAAKGSYNYAEKYFVEGAINYSGYNRYAPGHQYGLFYAGGAGWNMAKESWMQSATWLNQLKWRVTYGRTGNANVDNYGYFIWRQHFTQVAGTYPIGSNYPNGAGLGEQGVPGSQVLANVSATWEKADKLNAGVDMAFFNNRLLLTADYYHERYYDVMQTRGRSIALMGIAYPVENIGIDLYQGGEATLTYQDRIGSLHYFVTGNGAIQQSKALFMDEQYQAYPWNVHTGHPVGQRYGLIADGLLQTGAEAVAAPTIAGYTPHAGDIRYKDLNSDNVIDQFDVAPIGKERPLLYYGLSAGINYKGIEAGILLQGVANRENYVSNGYLDAGFQGQNNGYSQAYIQALGRWIPETATTASYPRLTAGGNGYNYSPLFQSSSYFLRNGNYIRIKNVNVGYDLPYAWIRKLKLRGIKIFANAQNLFTHAAYKGIDPEVSFPSYPIQKVINTGITVKL
ncbi:MULTISPECIES: SusC/RagA family TonB-linked outer membrane protein [Niastella]|uniref:SusC/RagA family TonB-linked outer membrane protein n=1 Tax=Niastella soli TaxID=2821487 RepID=A0ABS3YX11_9BACT|nr:SusC/RagA family TonB-linked outer membrane protein [Niastella soli]MBO9202460.1 SusC/RagA family TonB-linked outer membrane protein [Niastella soli]